jgi:hypothetical protein
VSSSDKSTSSTKVTRGDIEHKFRELQSELTTAAEGAKNKVLAIGAAAGVAVLLVAYVLGRRAGKKKSTVVEIRRLCSASASHPPARCPPAGA